MNLGHLVPFEKEQPTHTRVCVHTCIQEWLVWSVHFVLKLLLLAPCVPGWPLSTGQDQKCHRFCRKTTQKHKNHPKLNDYFFSMFSYRSQVVSCTEYAFLRGGGDIELFCM